MLVEMHSKMIKKYCPIGLVSKLMYYFIKNILRIGHLYFPIFIIIISPIFLLRNVNIEFVVEVAPNSRTAGLKI